MFFYLPHMIRWLHSSFLELGINILHKLRRLHSYKTKYGRFCLNIKKKYVIK